MEVFNRLPPAGITPSQKAAGERRVHVEGDAVVAQAGEQLVLDATVQRVVMSFVGGRLDPAVSLADLAHLRHLPRHVVADPEPLEVAFLVELVHGTERILVAVLAVGPVQVEHLDLIRLERLQAVQQPAAHILGLVRVAAALFLRMSC